MTTRIQADSSNSQGKSAPPRLARHWIDGGWVGSDLVSKSINPAAGAVLGQWFSTYGPSQRGSRSDRRRQPYLRYRTALVARPRSRAPALSAGNTVA